MTRDRSLTCQSNFPAPNRWWDRYTSHLLKIHHSLLWISIEAITWGEINSSSRTIQAASVRWGAVVQVKLERSHLVDACIIYSGGHDQIVTNTAEVLSIYDLSISSLAPSDSPRVLCDPVVDWSCRCRIGAPSNDKQIMRELNVTLGTSIRGIDPILVIDEIRCNVESGDGGTIIEDRLLQVRFSWDELETKSISLDGRDSQVEVAWIVVGTRVWIVLGECNAAIVRNDFKYCKWFLLNWNAIHDVLGTQGYGLVVLETILSLKWTGNCESLGSHLAITLLLDLANHKLSLSPIELARVVCVNERYRGKNSNTWKYKIPHI